MGAAKYAKYYDLLQGEHLKIESYPLVKQQGIVDVVNCRGIQATCCEKNDNHSFLAMPPNVFLTDEPILSSADCEQVISWAEEEAARLGSWTTSRHYAVPTTDIPVHTVSPMLDWFVDVLKRKIAPIVHAQFAGCT